MQNGPCFGMSLIVASGYSEGLDAILSRLPSALLSLAYLNFWPTHFHLL